MKFKSDYITPIGPDGIFKINTGDWRTQRPIINKDKCTKCGVCFLYCPVFSIEKREGSFIIDYSYCKGCAICAHECPTNAIDMIPEEGK